MFEIGIYLYDEIEVLDFAGPFEVFSTATRVHGRMHPGANPCFAVSTIGETGRSVRTRGGLLVLPHSAFGGHPPLDLLVVPGGVVNAEMENPAVLRWIQAQYEHARIVASVCTGAFLLGKAGLLKGKRVTTHWEDVADLRELLTESKVVEGVRWVDEGRVVTSAGISAGIDMSLHLVERLEGRALALATARQMDYVWTEG
jgi:transcriptional regulator GlxA family with amidase domain